ncbi:MAG: bifunctional phosphoribosylaminoimidazolecarboxamide formyltransferase/IMP cyclohydrolase [Dehalococcoidia bacterium]|nr:bifunctional phosphoribosylaminoimidazolecarboxamide formyltransferase/IMP cyclohydrolase [Dehalococcoidia bacterium]
MRALLAVYDKAGIVELGAGLHALGWELYSTGNTQRVLVAGGVPARAVAELTGHPEVFGGRVKTLHPKVHGGLLFRRGHAGDEAEAREHGIDAIEMVVANLYPFAETVRGDAELPLERALEEIDIGGPAMIRAAAKNHPWVVPLVDPTDYTPVLEALRAGALDQARRRALAAKAFQHVAHYDTLVAEYLRGGEEPFPEQLTVALTRAGDALRYGENPHQRAAFYRRDSLREVAAGIGAAVQHHGKGMSYTNVLDADAAFALVAECAEPALAIIKHTNPCCFATGTLPLAELYERALTQGDAVSAYGGIVAVNRPLDMALASALRERLSPVASVRMFFEIVIAPGFADGALAHLQRKSADLRILEAPLGEPGAARQELRSVRGGVLVQDVDAGDDGDGRAPVSSALRAPTARELADLRVAWTVCKHVKSNAIVLVRDGVLVGMGAGQPNRVESARLAVRAAGERARGAVLASDAFFPFPDTIEVAAAAGVTAAIHPGGSMRDAESVQVADAHGLALCTTGVRHFRH